MCPEKKQKTIEETEESPSEITTTQYLIETIKQLQTDNANLKLGLKKVKGTPSGKIGVAFIIPGILAIIFSIVVNSNVLALIGLSLTFWGALFFFITPVRYVESSLLDSTAISTYTSIDRIVKDLKFKGKSYYIPPYPKEVYLPEYMKGLKDPVVFISADTGGMPSIEELAKSKFLLENPIGICLAPPGLGLLTKFEKELGKSIAELQLEELCESLPPLIVGSLQLAKEINMRLEDNQVHIMMLDSTYKRLYTAEENLKSIHSLGCPLASAIACAITKATGKMVTIEKDSVYPDGQTIEIQYRVIEG
jgi:hypothetical protein